MNNSIPNTFGLKVKAKDFYEYSTVEELQAVLPRVRGQRWIHVGSGSNLLFTHDYEGIVLHSRIVGVEEVKHDNQKVWLKAGAGVVWDDFVAYTVAHGLHGAENLSYIPGEVGASAVQNIGAYGVEAGDLISEVHAVEVSSGKLRVFQADECAYAYRSSVFKQALKERYVITHVVYALSRSFNPDLEYGAIRRGLDSRGLSASSLTGESLRQLVIDIRRSKLPDPKDLGSAGSFFMNPVVDRATFEALQRQYPDMPHYDMPQGVKIPAGWMIEQCGWKGRALGRAGVYDKQALVLVNLGGATGEEILALSNAVRQSVKEKFGIGIHPEAIII